MSDWVVGSEVLHQKRILNFLTVSLSLEFLQLCTPEHPCEILSLWQYVIDPSQRTQTLKEVKNAIVL